MYGPHFVYPLTLLVDIWVVSSLEMLSIKLLHHVFFAGWFVCLFWPRHAARGILVPRPGIEPESPAAEAWSPNHWTSREVLCVRVLCTPVLLFLLGTCVVINFYVTKHPQTCCLKTINIHGLTQFGRVRYLRVV